MQLHMFTPLTYVMSSGGEVNMHQCCAPMVVIHTFSKIGYRAPPHSITDPMICIDLKQSGGDGMRNDGAMARAVTVGNTATAFEELVDVECTVENRHCAQYGLSPVLCVCTTDPLNRINLDVVREYCWFAMKDVREIDNSHKRNMLYWWYMTNIYNISGRGVTKKPLDCLTAAIRCAYPEDNGKYKGYRKLKKMIICYSQSSEGTTSNPFADPFCSLIWQSLIAVESV